MDPGQIKGHVEESDGFNVVFCCRSSSPQRLLLTSSSHSSRERLRPVLAERPPSLQFIAGGTWRRPCSRWSSGAGGPEMGGADRRYQTPPMLQVAEDAVLLSFFFPQFLPRKSHEP